MTSSPTRDDSKMKAKMTSIRERFGLSTGPSYEIRDLCKKFMLSDDTLRQIMKVFLQEVNRGLGRFTHHEASVKCYNTYIQDLPKGIEEGQFMSLVFESPRIRVLSINIRNNVLETDSNAYEIDHAIVSGGTGSDLFDFLAQCVIDFCRERELDYNAIPLGFTFGFPAKQEALNAATLQKWVKGFNCTNSIGKDVVLMLKDAFDRKGAPGIAVIAVINDTTGTLMSCAFNNTKCKIALILAGGYNLCYVEKITNVDLFDGVKKRRTVIINTECGAFGDDGELDAYRSEFDRDLDESSGNPGVHVNEKMISGLYVGEIVRLLIVRAIQRKHLFEGNGATHVSQKNDFLLRYMSEICGDLEGSFTNCKRVLSLLGIPGQVTEQDMKNVRYICECVYKRSANLVASQLATLIVKMGYEEVTVGVDGAMYQGSPMYQDVLAGKVRQLVGRAIKVDFVLAEDGSGRGAALVAAAAAVARVRVKSVST